MSELTVRDIEILLEAMDAWKSCGFGEVLMKGLVSSMIPDKEKRDEAFEKRMQENDDMAEQRRSEEETVVLLKAKLIGIKTKILVGEATSILTGENQGETS